MQNYSDEDLILLFKTGNDSQRQKAFDSLYMRYSKPITSFFYLAFRQDHEKARDFAHDVFLKLLEAPDKFDDNRKFKPWIFRIAANMCKNEFRHRLVINKFVDYSSERSAIFLQANETERKLRDCIKRLHPDQRSLIVLRFKINLTIKEIAEIFECPEGTIKSRLFYSTQALSKLYTE